MAVLVSVPPCTAAETESAAVLPHMTCSCSQADFAVVGSGLKRPCKSACEHLSTLQGLPSTVFMGFWVAWQMLKCWIHFCISVHLVFHEARLDHQRPRRIQTKPYKCRIELQGSRVGKAPGERRLSSEAAGGIEKSGGCNCVVERLRLSCQASWSWRIDERDMWMKGDWIWMVNHRRILGTARQRGRPWEVVSRESDKTEWKIKM